jgi:hypothetical protein
MFIAKNEGRTPARIKSIWSKPLAAARDGRPQVPPDEETAESLISTPARLLPPNGTFTFPHFNEDQLKLMHKTDFTSIYFYGRIIYFNTLGPNPDKPYETKWLYWMIPARGYIPFPDPRHPEHNTWT